MKYQFFEKESLLSPFHSGTYEGRKKILALGAGFERQRRAMWHIDSTSDTVLTSTVLLGLDLFGELPGKTNNSLTFYTGYFYYDFGPNLYR